MLSKEAKIDRLKYILSLSNKNATIAFHVRNYIDKRITYTECLEDCVRELYEKNKRQEEMILDHYEKCPRPVIRPYEKEINNYKVDWWSFFVGVFSMFIFMIIYGWVNAK